MDEKNKEIDLSHIPTKEEYDKLFKNRGKKVVFYLNDNTPVSTGDWFYVKEPTASHLTEVEPDILEGIYKSYYREVNVIIRLGSINNYNKKIIMELDEFLLAIEKGEIRKLRMPLFKYGDIFRNKFNKEVLSIVDVPRSINDKTDDFVYYVRICTEIAGCNYQAMSEKDITNFYNTVGVIKR